MPRKYRHVITGRGPSEREALEAAAEKLPHPVELDGLGLTEVPEDYKGIGVKIDSEDEGFKAFLSYNLVDENKVPTKETKRHRSHTGSAPSGGLEDLTEF